MTIFMKLSRNFNSINALINKIKEFKIDPHDIKLLGQLLWLLINFVIDWVIVIGLFIFGWKQICSVF